MRSSTHGRALWRRAAVLGILALGLVWWAVGEDYTMQNKSEQTGSELARRIEARIQQSGKPDLEKARLGVLLHTEEPKTTDALFKTLAAGKQDDEYARLGYAKARILAGHVEDGLVYLQKLDRQHPNNPSILYEMAMVLMRQGQEAVVLLKRVVEIDPFHARANYELAKWFAASSRPDQAVEYARRVLSVEDPASPLAEKALLLLDKLIPEKKP